MVDDNDSSKEEWYSLARLHRFPIPTKEKSTSQNIKNVDVTGMNENSIKTNAVGIAQLEDNTINRFLNSVGVGTRQFRITLKIWCSDKLAIQKCLLCLQLRKHENVYLSSKKIQSFCAHLRACEYHFTNSGKVIYNHCRG